MELIKPGNNVLVLWKDNNGIEKLVDQIKALSSVNVAVENIHRLSFSGHSPSSFDIVISNFTTCPTSNHSSDILDLILTLLKPNGILVLREAGTDASALSSTLKISGFIVVDEPKIVELAESDNLKAALDKDNVKLYELTCQKPNFEVGSAVKLSFANKAKVAAIWKLGDDDTEDEDIIDSDNLLDEDDFAKPDPASLRVCGTTGKRKACKDCSCGLAEELQAEGAPKTTANSTQKSSCGSCYLGDAFRCASCPYLGMPAFKPGEKIQLSDNQLKADT